MTGKYEQRLLKEVQDDGGSVIVPPLPMNPSDEQKKRDYHLRELINDGTLFHVEGNRYQLSLHDRELGDQHEEDRELEKNKAGY